MVIGNNVKKSIEGQINQRFIFWSMVATVIFYPLWGFITPNYLIPGAEDGFLYRLNACVLSFYGLLIFFFNDNKEKSEKVAGLSACTVIAHYFYICYSNDYNQLYMAGTFIPLVTFLSMLVNKKTVFLFLFLTLLGASGCLFTSLNQKDSSFYLISVIVVGSITSFLTLFRIEVLKRLDKAIIENEENKKIAYHQSKLASLGVIAAGVAHEINNPLTVIKGNVMIALKSLEKGNLNLNMLKKTMEKVEILIDRISAIIKTLKSYSRVDTSEMEIFNLSEMILETIDLVRNNHEVEGIELEASIVDNTYVDGNRGRLQQVLMNLLANAKDAIQKEPKRVEVILLAKEGLVRVYVNDTGEGISEEIQDKIFEPFFTSKGVNKGTGLGLGISNKIMEEHKGRLIVAKTGQEGTSFMMEIKQSFEHPKKS